MMKHAIRISACAFGLAATTVLASLAHAAGFQISEQSARGLGRAFSGYGLVGDDVSAAFYNPAALTLLEGTQSTAALYFLDVGGKVSDDGSTFAVGAAVGPSSGGTGNADPDNLEEGVVTNIFFATDINDQLKFGLGITTPYGLVTEYDDENWVGRYHALKSKLLTIDINPSLGYRFNDYFSFGFGVSAQYAKARLTQAVWQGFVPGRPDGTAEVVGDDWALGWNMGAMIEFDKDTRVGVSFRSKVAVDISDGDLNLDNVVTPTAAGLVTVPDTGASAAIDLPETVHIGAYRRLNDQWAVTAGARWTNWSRFDELRIQFADGRPDNVVDESWEDTWTFNVGVSYDFNPMWQFRAGYQYDETPVPDSEHRTPRIPDNTRNWVSVGASFTPVKNFNLDLGYAYLFVSDSEINNALPLAAGVTDTLRADVKSSDANVFGAQLTYKF